MWGLQPDSCRRSPREVLLGFQSPGVCPLPLTHGPVQEPQVSVEGDAGSQHVPSPSSEDAGTSPVGLRQGRLTAEGQAREAACPGVRNKTQLLPPSCDRPCDRERQRAGLSLLGVCPSLRPLPCTWCNAPLQGFHLPVPLCMAPASPHHTCYPHSCVCSWAAPLCLSGEVEALAR